MKTSELIFCTALILKAAAMPTAAGQAPASANTSDILPGLKTSFFAESTGDVPEETGVNPKGNLLFRPFVSVPKGEVALPAASYLQVCQDFASWARAVIKAEYVPSDSFIVAHLQLFAATAERRHDVAFLACQKDKMQYLIVQAGGLGGRIFFITERSDNITVADGTTALDAMMAAVREYLNLPSDLVPPGFQFEKHGRLYGLKAGYDRTKPSILTHAQCILSTREVALSFWKWGPLLGEPNPAHAPEPDRWFRWAMGVQPSTPFPRD